MGELKTLVKSASEHLYIRILSGGSFGGRKTEDLRSRRVSAQLCHAIAYGGKPLVDLIRGGKAYDDRDTEHTRVTRGVRNAMKDRVSHID